MSEADKIIESLKNSGKKVEEFYVSNKTSDKNVATEEDIKNVKEFIDYAQEVIDDMEYERPVDVTVYQKYLTSMQSILAEREQDKKRIQELEEALLKVKDKNTTLFITCRNSIPKQVVIDVLKNNRNELFSMTYLSKEQYRPYEMQVERINKIEQELLEGEIHENRT